jgi:hypothetical protein
MSMLASILYSRHVTIKTTDSNYVYFDCRGATVGDRGSMAWMPAYIAVPNLLSMILMCVTWKSCLTKGWTVLYSIIIQKTL